MEVPAASGFFSLLVKVVPASKVKARLVRAFVLYTRIRKSNPYGVLCPPSANALVWSIHSLCGSCSVAGAVFVKRSFRKYSTVLSH